MSEIHRLFDQLLTDVAGYLENQQQVYGNEIYSNYDIVELLQTPVPQTQEQQLAAFYHRIKSCQKCKLSQTRRNLVFGTGNPNADIMLIGEAPGHEEDIQSKPFVGAAGQLLTKILAAINLKREEVYITNIVKCRPPQNRDPLPAEQASCMPYLWKQIEIIKPRFILALGRVAAQALLNTNKTMNDLRGRVYNLKGIKMIVTYHPAALLRNPQWKRATWEDVQKLQKLYHG